MHCKSVYCPKSYGPKDHGSVYRRKSDAHKNQDGLSENSFALTLFEREFRPANHFINFFLKKFGKKYARHAEIAKEVKQRNDDIFGKVMVGIE